MRYFIGLELPSHAKQAVDAWREKAWLAGLNQKPVPAPNFHITLAFLGQVTEPQLDRLQTALGEIDCAPFALTIDHFGYWQKPPVAWLGCSEKPPQLSSLQLRCVAASRRAGLQLSEREYVPHITLARKCMPPVPPPLFEPNLPIEFSAFCLFESVSTDRGVTYPVRLRWPLTVPFRSPSHKMNSSGH
ncbi:RNA 2',3'-cyclic phosphodiesterase [Alteromonas oceanisediminis]|uniref:RNA 2',3'-cyclic phosphodiesterase n=1 Tax=Alteromonas oceanisediminis TaxID=2836180 RepID=UPI001BDA6C71|nr:RNA 2',3'-cyclic phosphodiesterase [Alteromonas oceanisediminis]MBT0586161.1 RNA 2',3'-cyclic phosphodiesterase [Alteromonas oceanisediminis]